MSVCVHTCIDTFLSFSSPTGYIVECYPRSITLRDNSWSKCVFWPAESNSLLVSWQAAADNWNPQCTLYPSPSSHKITTAEWRRTGTATEYWSVTVRKTWTTENQFYTDATSSEFRRRDSCHWVWDRWCEEAC